jgi:DNA-binding LacI/PurR family transcriptional regulator
MKDKAQRPKMTDVARVVGVSAATVSRVLAGVDGASSEKTAAEIRQAAKDLGYVVNGVAASLRNQQTRSVGLVIADVGNPFYGLLASGVENRLSEAGYGVILGNTSNSVEHEKELVRLLIGKRVDALVVATSSRTGGHIQEAIDLGMKVVLVDSDLPEIQADAVLIDNAAISESAVKYLIEMGHTEIGIITARLEASSDRERMEGYDRALRKQGLKSDPLLCACGESTFDGGRRAAIQLLNLHRPPTALFATNNLMTVGALVALGEAGLSLPRDMSIIGFDDMEWYGIANPPVTAIRQPAYEMGRVAAERLLATMRRHRASKPQRLLLETELIIRQSVMPPVRSSSVRGGEKRRLEVTRSARG